MDPKGKAPAPIPAYRPDAQKGYLPSVPFPHAGPEPSGQTLRNILKGNSLDGSRGAFSLEASYSAIGMEYESDPPDSDDESICDLDDPDGSEDGVECCIVATFSEELGIPCQNPDCPRYIPIPHPNSVPDPSRESGPPSGPSPGAGPSGVYGSLGGDSSSQEDDIRRPSKESMHVHRDPPIASGPGEMPVRMTPTPAEIDLLLQNVIEPGVSAKLDTQIQESQERCRLKFQKIESLQRLDLYDQWCQQIHHCYCRFHREHPPVPVKSTAKTMEVDVVSLESAWEQAFLKVAQEESQELPAANTIESWLNEQEEVVRNLESIGSWSEAASHVSCAHHCSCRKEIATLAAENQAIKFKFHLFSIGRSFAHPSSHLPNPPVGSTCSVADEATEVFSLAPTTDSTAEEQKKKREKLKERVFESRNPQRVLAEKRSAGPMIAARVLLAQSLLGAAGVSIAAQVNPILAGGGGIEDIINPVRAKLRAIAKQPKYNGNPRRWAVFKRESSLWVGKNKLRDDEKLDALLECLEGPIRDTWIKSYTDRAHSSNPLTYSELFSLLEGRGSRLPEDHYRTLLTSFPNIPKLILREVQNKRLRFENLVNEAESAGEHLSDGELKAIIFAKMPADTAASLRQEQSNEKVKSWWTEVTGFPENSCRFQVRDALKKCSPTNFSKCKEKDGAWRLKFAEKEDRDIFNEVVNRGVSFGGTRLVAKPWVFSFTPTELWEELEKLADANHQQFHEGLSRNPPSKGGNQKTVNNTQSKDCAICLSFGHTNRAKSHSTENHWWNKTDAEGVAQEASKDPPKAPVKKVDENCQSTHSGKGKGSKGQQTSGDKGNQGQSSQGRSPENFKNGNGMSNSAKGNGGKAIFPREKANPVASSQDIPRE